MRKSLSILAAVALVAFGSAAFAADDTGDSSPAARQARMDAALQDARSGRPSADNATLGTRVKQDTKDAGHAIGNGARRAGHAVGDAASATGHAISNGAHRTGQAISNGAHRTGHAIHNATHPASRRLLSPVRGPRDNARVSGSPVIAPATLSEQDGVRYLHLGTPWVQGAMRCSKPNAIELEYVQRMMAWMLWRPTDEVAQGHAVQLGLGAATITRFAYRVLRMRVTAVEINPTVIAACRLWFHLGEDDKRLQVVQKDAARWVEDPANLATVDALSVDLYDHDAAAPVLDDAGFYRACHGTLVDGGLMAVNLFGRYASFDESLARMAEAFGTDQLWTLRPTREGNTVVVAARGVEVPGREVLSARADNIEARYGLPARKWLRMVRPYQPRY